MLIRTTTLPKFAQLLGQPVTTLKRLLNLGVLPGTLVEKPAGKHWRVSFSDEQLQHCRALVVFWSLWRRKPRASKTYTRRDELNSTAIKLILAEPRSEEAEDLTSPQERVDAFFEAVVVLNKKQKDVEGVWWHQKILANPTNVMAATFILRSAVAEFRKKHHRQPTRKQLAETLGMSESSIYRFPFGKTALDLAYLDQNFAQTDDEDTDEERCEDATNPKQSEYDQIARNDHALQHRPQTPSRDYFAAKTKRQLRKLKPNSFELAWEEHNTGNIRGGALLAFPVHKLEAKRRLERLSEPQSTDDDYNSRATVRRYSRQNRRSTELEERDSTFGSWAVAAYVVEPDGKYRWWTNFNRIAGRTDSVARAQREILAVIGRSRPRFRIVNLREMLGDSRR